MIRQWLGLILPDGWIDAADRRTIAGVQSPVGGGVTADVNIELRAGRPLTKVQVARRKTDNSNSVMVLVNKSTVVTVDGKLFG